MNRFTSIVGILTLSAIACGGGESDDNRMVDDAGVIQSDEDGDGFFTPDDCDDNDAQVNPAQTEDKANGKDDNCDGYVDEVKVDPEGSGDYETIQEAIDDDQNAGAIIIAPGTYSGHLEIDRDIALIGENAYSETIVDGGGTGILIDGGEHELVVDHITVQNGERALACSGGTLVAKSVIIKNNGTSSGAGIYANNCVVEVDESTFDNNHADRLTGAGGSIFLEECTGHIKTSSIVNSTSHQGGGINVTDGNVEISGNTLKRNTAFGFTPAGFGGGVFTNSDGPITDNQFIESFCEYRGGGLAVDNASPAVSGNTFLRNQSQSDGGGAYFLGSESIITDNLIEDNYTLDDGAGMNFKGREINDTVKINHVTLRNNRFINNRALGDGGAIKTSHGENQFEYNLFQGNKSASRGGAIEIDDEINDGSDGTVSDYLGNIFIANQAGGEDLAEWPVIPDPTIHPEGSWTVDGYGAPGSGDDEKVIALRRTNRRSQGIGGAVNVWDSVANFSIDNNLFVRNTATFGGAAIHTHRRDLPGREPGLIKLRYFTAVFNESPQHAAAWFEGSRISVENSIFASNSSGIGFTTTENGSSPATVEAWTYNNVSPASFTGFGNPTGNEGNISADPLFAGADDFTLTAGSPAEDAADPQELDRDGSRADMGAYGGPEGLEP